MVIPLAAFFKLQPPPPPTHTKKNIKISECLEQMLLPDIDHQGNDSVTNVNFIVYV